MNLVVNGLMSSELSLYIPSLSSHRLTVEPEVFLVVVHMDLQGLEEEGVVMMTEEVMAVMMVVIMVQVEEGDMAWGIQWLI